MLNRFFGKQTHTYLHILGVSGIAFALPWSKVMMSISMMFIVLNLILEGNYRSYWLNLKANRIYWFIAGIYALQLLGLLWSSNVGESLHTIKQQLPFIAIPTVLIAKPIIEKRHIEIIFMAFLAPLLATSLYNFFSYQHWIGNRVYDDIRGMSLSTSHIRYGLLIAMGGAITLVCAESNKKRLPICLSLLVWFGFYTFYSQVISGVICFTAVLAIYCVYHLWHYRKIVALVTGVLLLLGAVVPFVWLFQPLTVNPADYSNLPQFTANGNPYVHDLGFVDSETKKPVHIYVCQEELEKEWNLRSDLYYSDQTIKGDQISHTLIRYLASMHYTRDSAGVTKLTDADIRNVELGRTSTNYQGLMARMHSLRFELNYALNPNGHSLLQRLEYWKTGVQIARENWLIGVGSGDVQDAFNVEYEQSNSPLVEANRRRAHNQLLTYFITFGILGFVLFVALIGLFIRKTLLQKTLIGLLFITISLISFFMEDTLETQTGVTFFALFLGLFLSTSAYSGKVEAKSNVE